ncbi:MAG: DUF4397 domain-containing protein [Ferruginibacter sp.]
MKFLLIILFACISLATLPGCKKDKDYIADRSFITPGDALLKINYASMYPANPSVQLSINGERVSGLITGRTPFPGGGYNTNGQNFADYLAVKPGANTLKISIPNKNANTDSIVLYSVALQLDAGMNYTVHVADTFAKTRSVLLKDDLTQVQGDIANYKFVNLMPNVPLIDLYYGATKVASAIPYMGSSAVFSVPAAPAAFLLWSIRETGTSPTSTALASYSSGNTILNKRIYTTFALGYKGTTATNTKPYISFFLVK